MNNRFTHLDYHNKGYDDLPLFTGEVLRDEAIAKVSEHNETWMELAIRSAQQFMLEKDDFTGEDIRFYCSWNIGCPKHPNAYGALINTLLKRKIIKPTGEYRAMRDSMSHARRTPVYQKYGT